MSWWERLTTSAGSLLRSLRGTPKATNRPATPAPSHAGRPPATITEYSPGRSGPGATVEVDPRQIGPVRMTYSPVTDGDPDPGEIVWTWVPFEERDGRGKDRPVLVVAVEGSGRANGGREKSGREKSGRSWLAVQLTSKSHQGDAEFVAIGAGAWDSAGRPSWVNIDRVFRVYDGGMRREACALPPARYQAVEQRLRQRYGWG